MEDKIPPRIDTPAQDKTVECDGKGNQVELWAWLEGRSKAWAFDACYKIDEYMPGCGGLGG
ncbi:MAG: hypothetical protein ABDI20_09545 [Candidatus Bipolaricaulaceae bacterium]